MVHWVNELAKVEETSVEEETPENCLPKISILGLSCYFGALKRKVYYFPNCSKIVIWRVVILIQISKSEHSQRDE